VAAVRRPIFNFSFSVRFWDKPSWPPLTFAELRPSDFFTALFHTSDNTTIPFLSASGVR
jgi:hypothetical protein